MQAHKNMQQRGPLQRVQEGFPVQGRSAPQSVQYAPCTILKTGIHTVCGKERAISCVGIQDDFWEREILHRNPFCVQRLALP